MTIPTVSENIPMGLMRYFTAEWLAKCQELDPNFNPQLASDDYSKYFSEISSQLPEAIHDMESACSLHDARLRAFELEPKEGTFTVQFDRVKFGDEGEEQSISLTYSGVGLVRSTAASEGAILGASGFGDLGYHEFHLLRPEYFEHSFLFASGIELGIEFKSFEFAVVE